MGIAYNTSIVRNGLVLHLDAANTKSYPGSGTTWFDMSGNGYNHSLKSGAVFTTVDNAKCIDTAVEGRYIQDAGTTFTFGPSHTMIAWARPLADSQVSTWRTLWRTQPDDHPLLIQDGTNLIGYYDNNSDAFVSYGINAGTIGIENKWTMFTLVSNGTTTTLYINNLQYSGTVNYTASGTSHDVIGAAIGSQSFGYTAAVQLYNRALSESEIKQNFEALRGRYGI